MSRFACVFGLCLALVGCGKQGAGERCQIAADCEDGLDCSISTLTCTPTGTTPTVDAPTGAAVDAPPPDAPIFDAPPPDAPEADAS